MTGSNTDRLRALPAAHTLLESAPARDLAQRMPHDALRDLVREVIDGLRHEALDATDAPSRDELFARAVDRLSHEAGLARHFRLRRVINATGVVIHTNLGRAPLGNEVARHVADVARGYATLEYDLAEGGRGHRDRIVADTLTQLVGGDDAVVVNNNAAAVLLTATALGAGREVIVSRGELVEIGGGFRVPEILQSCGATLVEVGTTNRTHIDDYERAITERTAFILKVHRSNFAITGFTSEASIRDLAALARPRKIPVVEDLGSGALIGYGAFELPDEQQPSRSLREGADLVMFSGDKLLGGPQAGIAVGTRALIEQLRRHPLARALRPGRLVMSALEATLRIYAEGRARDAIPTVAMLTAAPGALRARAETLRTLLDHCLADDSELLSFARDRCDVQPSDGVVGGGAMPTAVLSSWCVAVKTLNGAEATRLETLLRGREDLPIIVRVTDEKVVLDLRTVSDDEVHPLATGLASALRTLHNSPHRGANDASTTVRTSSDRSRSEE